ncbi:hypothetical protein DPMN_135714 [Dreissena polymorpha]|uniref:Uncharacterized protein n=1 Tax=Dreissena polymorpha TaxID=45954 RepID=A0A9D4G2F9_DREPO|nr:hypothetical protein DPMN_135714 [Dreissena polymorpha]
MCSQKNDTSLIKNIIKETLEETKEKFLGSVLKKLEIIEGSIFEHKNEIDALKKLKRSEERNRCHERKTAEFSHVSSLNDLEQYGTASGFLASQMIRTNNHRWTWPNNR